RAWRLPLADWNVPYINIEQNFHLRERGMGSLSGKTLFQETEVEHPVPEAIGPGRDGSWRAALNRKAMTHCRIEVQFRRYARVLQHAIDLRVSGGDRIISASQQEGRRSVLGHTRGIRHRRRERR